MKRYLRWAKLTVAAMAAALVLGTTVTAEAQYGSRYGGRSYSGGGSSYGYRGGYRGYRYGYGYGYGYAYRPGYGHYYVYRPYGWSPFVRVGAAGTLFLLLGVAGIIYAAYIINRRRRAMMARPVGYDPFGGMVYEYGTPEEPTQVIKAQVALLATARHLQQELERIARADSSTPQGLAHMLRETAILLARAQPYWKAGFVGQETFEVSEDAERRFEEAVVGERVKLDAEGLGPDARGPRGAEDQGKVGRFIVVTLLVAVQGPILEDNHTPSSDEMKAALLKLAAIPGSTMRALEVIWAPSDPNGALDEDDLLMKYSGLSSF